MEPFFLYALAAALGVALVAGPLGCFVIWRRLAYFGDTLAHSALLGVALAVLLDLEPATGVFIAAASVSLLLLLLQRQSLLASDTLLAILAHSTLALGLILLALMSWGGADLFGYLFGDILAVTQRDLIFIYGGGGLVLAVMAVFWRPLLAATVSPEIAAAENLRPDRSRLLLTLLLAAVVAMAIKVVGIFLITSMLIIPAAAARRFASGPEQMALIAALIGCLASVAGLFASYFIDLPAGPAIVFVSMLLFLVSLVRRAHN